MSVGRPIAPRAQEPQIRYISPLEARLGNHTYMRVALCAATLGISELANGIAFNVFGCRVRTEEPRRHGFQFVGGARPYGGSSGSNEGDFRRLQNAFNRAALAERH